MIRQHASTLTYELLGNRRKMGGVPRAWSMNSRCVCAPEGCPMATYCGMMIAVPATRWGQLFGSLTATRLASVLKFLAAKVRPDRFRKNVRGPRKPRPRNRISGKQNHHVSTARIIAKRKSETTCNDSLKAVGNCLWPFGLMQQKKHSLLLTAFKSA